MIGSESQRHERGSSNSLPIQSLQLYTEADIPSYQHGEHIDAANNSSSLSRTRYINQGTNIHVDSINRQPLDIMNGRLFKI